MRPRLGRNLVLIGRITGALIAAWLVEVAILVTLKAIAGLDPADLTSAIAAPGTPVNGLLNTLLLLTPEVLLARAIYRRLARSR